MKNIKYLFICLSFLAFYACDDNDEEVIDLTEVLIEATISADKELVAETDNVGYSVSINQAYSNDLDLRINVRFNDARQFSTNLTVPAGETTASGTLLFRSDNNIPINPSINSGILTDFVTLKVIGVVFSEPVVGENYVVNSNEVLLDLIDNAPAPLTEPGIAVSFLWETSNDDYDVLYNSPSLGVINLGGATANNPELITIPDSLIDTGVSTLVHNPFSVAGTDPVNYRVIINTLSSDGTFSQTILPGVLDPSQNDPNLVYGFVLITKTVDATDPANPVSSYTFIN